MSAGGFPAALAFTLREEGGFVDDPQDPGGATNKGITIATFQHYHPGATVDALRLISNADAGAIYHAGYWNAVRAEELPAGVDLMVFDFGVNAGPGRSIGILQSALGVAVDRIIGPVTLRATLAADRVRLVNDLAARQLAYYRSLSTWATFGDGWGERTDRRTEAAEKLAGTPPAPASISTGSMVLPRSGLSIPMPAGAVIPPTTPPDVPHATAVLAGLCIEADVFTAEEWEAALANSGA